MAQPIEFDEMLSKEEAAKRLGVSVARLAAWRSEGRGPAYVRYNGRIVVYPARAVQQYIRRETYVPSVQAFMEEKHVCAP